MTSVARWCVVWLENGKARGVYFLAGRDSLFCQEWWLSWIDDPQYGDGVIVGAMHVRAGTIWYRVVEMRFRWKTCSKNSSVRFVVWWRGCLRSNVEIVLQLSQRSVEQCVVNSVRMLGEVSVFSYQYTSCWRCQDTGSWTSISTSRRLGRQVSQHDDIFCKIDCFLWTGRWVTCMPECAPLRCCHLKVCLVGSDNARAVQSAMIVSPVQVVLRVVQFLDVCLQLDDWLIELCLVLVSLTITASNTFYCSGDEEVFLSLVRLKVLVVGGVWFGGRIVSWYQVDFRLIVFASCSIVWFAEERGVDFSLGEFFYSGRLVKILDWWRLFSERNRLGRWQKLCLSRHADFWEEGKATAPRMGWTLAQCTSMLGWECATTSVFDDLWENFVAWRWCCSWASGP